MSFFKIEHKNSKARAGKLILRNKYIETPVFMPCGTQGTVKSSTSHDLEKIGFKLILGNTYHLTMRPGAEIIQKVGGIKKFISYKGRVLTDSGGFQVFSLKGLRKVKEEGVLFASHIDGKKCFFSPEFVIEVQKKFDSDIVMVLDVCSSYPSNYHKVKQDMNLTHVWAKKSKKIKLNKGQKIFGIIQGGTYKDLRKQSAEFILSLGFDGIAIGGLSVKEPKQKMQEIISFLSEIIPEEFPVYLMGVGDPLDILFGVENGIDMFDCVMPTRLARHGTIFTFNGKINIKNAKYKNDFTPISASCNCQVCKKYHKAYLRHLFMVKEPTAQYLATYHNLYFFKKFMDNIYEAIVQNQFARFKKKFIENYLTN